MLLVREDFDRIHRILQDEFSPEKSGKSCLVKIGVKNYLDADCASFKF